MTREPLFKRQVRGLLGWFGRGRDRDPEEVREHALEHSQRAMTQLPDELVALINNNRHDTPLLKRQIIEYCERSHLDLDTRMINAINDKLAAANITVDLTTKLTRNLHGLRHLPGRLDRTEQLDQVEDQVRMAEAQNRLDQAQSPLHKELQEEELKAKIAKARAHGRYYGQQVRSGERVEGEVDTAASPTATGWTRRSGSVVKPPATTPAVRSSPAPESPIAARYLYRHRPAGCSEAVSRRVTPSEP
jgi:hypothetical protein